MKPIKGFNTIPIYIYNHGIWETDTGTGRAFTKEEVKKIYIDHENKCIVVLLKDGTKINPDFVYGIDEETLQLKLNAWKVKILQQKGKKEKPYKEWKKYSVYQKSCFGPLYVDDSIAKSPIQAVNNVRWKYGGADYSNDDYFAMEVLDDGTEISTDTTPTYYFYALEFCVMSGDMPCFYQPYADYEVMYAPSISEAEYYIGEKYTHHSDFESCDMQVYFGREKEFDSEKKAKRCIYEWQLKNEEEFNNEKAQ